MKRNMTPALSAMLALLCVLLCACSSAAPAAPAPTAPPTADAVISVSTVDGLLAALGSDRTISLAAGSYDLSTASDYGQETQGCYEWVEVYDGYELCVSGLRALTIEGGGDAAIAAAARYAYALCFEDCSELALSGLTLGHTRGQGSCTGGVLSLRLGEKARVESCGLYGCGTVGISAEDFDELTVTDCEIYDCTTGAVGIHACSGAVISDSRVYNCGTAWGVSVFSVTNSYGFAAVNCEIYGNSTQYLLRGYYSGELYMTGCSMTGGNDFSGGVFCLTGCAPVIDGCDFSGCDFPGWYGVDDPEAKGRCVSAGGAELSERQLAGMELAPAPAFAGFKPEPEPPTVEKIINAEGLAVVRVKTVDELLAAIASHTVIYLDAELFNLSTASGYGLTGGENYSWAANPDGPQLCLYGLKELSIISEGGATIAAIPRSVDVLSFTGCDNVTLSGLTIGHTEEPGACSGGVLRFEGCGGVTIDRCRLFGCGILGVNAFDCRDMLLSETEIYDCSMGAVSAGNTSALSLADCDIHDCAAPELSLLGCTRLSYNGETLAGGIYALKDGKPQPWSPQETE